MVEQRKVVPLGPLMTARATNSLKKHAGAKKINLRYTIKTDKCIAFLKRTFHNGGAPITANDRREMLVRSIELMHRVGTALDLFNPDLSMLEKSLKIKNKIMLQSKKEESKITIDASFPKDIDRDYAAPITSVKLPEYAAGKFEELYEVFADVPTEADFVNHIIQCATTLISYVDAGYEYEGISVEHDMPDPEKLHLRRVK